MVEKRFDELLNGAKREVPPRIDVTQRVMLRLEELQVERMRERVWIAAGAFSLAAAMLMCGLVFPVWEVFQDPMLALMEPMRLALQVE